ncbi:MULTISPECIES: PH domain-containing protein [Carnobacterium]|uniref:YdbS-like PH domain-containing protein n=1 Tax=Carnobacterium alterfunditum TaxID=28230 RepID=A0A1N6FSQ5_9LACT|nr:MULTISPECIES: PH domain-containing protein [Carnobacterium]SIN98283.1 hypothetical protein SAMN05878443_0802 [Carnobacterium alterfunditum]
MGPKNMIDPQVLKLWRIRGCFNSLPLVGVALVYNFFIQVMPNTGLPDVGIYITIGLALIGGYVFIYLLPTLTYQSWRVDYNKDEIDFISGILITKRVTIPIIRVQNVESSIGPLAKKMGMMSLTISTAATSHKLPELPEEEALEVQKKIRRLIRNSL